MLTWAQCQNAVGSLGHPCLFPQQAQRTEVHHFLWQNRWTIGWCHLVDIIVGELPSVEGNGESAVSSAAWRVPKVQTDKRCLQYGRNCEKEKLTLLLLKLFFFKFYFICITQEFLWIQISCVGAQFQTLEQSLMIVAGTDSLKKLEKLEKAEGYGANAIHVILKLIQFDKHFLVLYPSPTS